MCRLFGMNAGNHEARVSYWLLDASDSMLRESHRNPDGTGLDHTILFLSRPD